MIRKIVAVVFGLLSLVFLARLAQYGYKWLSHASSPDLNYKALTAWCAIYVVVCAAIAWAAIKLPKDESDESQSVS